jgi:hypothetical protein
MVFVNRINWRPEKTGLATELADRVAIGRAKTADRKSGLGLHGLQINFRIVSRNQRSGIPTSHPE